MWSPSAVFCFLLVTSLECGCCAEKQTKFDFFIPSPRHLRAMNVRGLVMQDRDDGYVDKYMDGVDLYEKHPLKGVQAPDEGSIAVQGGNDLDNGSLSPRKGGNSDSSAIDDTINLDPGVEDPSVPPAPKHFKPRKVFPRNPEEIPPEPHGGPITLITDPQNDIMPPPGVLQDMEARRQATSYRTWPNSASAAFVVRSVNPKNSVDDPQNPVGLFPSRDPNPNGKGSPLSSGDHDPAFIIRMNLPRGMMKSKRLAPLMRRYGTSNGSDGWRPLYGGLRYGSFGWRKQRDLVYY